MYAGRLYTGMRSLTIKLLLATFALGALPGCALASLPIWAKPPSAVDVQRGPLPAGELR